jgi:hypothetical protein
MLKLANMLVVFYPRTRTCVRFIHVSFTWAADVAHDLSDYDFSSGGFDDPMAFSNGQGQVFLSWAKHGDAPGKEADQYGAFDARTVDLSSRLPA